MELDWRPAVSRRRAFTLVEVLIVVLLAGIITSLALVPVVFTIRRVVEMESSYNDTAALSRALAFVGQEAAGGLRLAPVVLRIEERSALGVGDDDVLIVASAAPAKQNEPAGSVVYKILSSSLMNENFVPGLYRWLFPGVLPEAVNPDALDEEEGRLVLPYAVAFNVEAIVPPDRLDEYSGPLPAGLAMTLVRNREGREERLENVFVFP